MFLTPCRPGLPVATVSPSVSPQVHSYLDCNLGPHLLWLCIIIITSQYVIYRRVRLQYYGCCERQILRLKNLPLYGMLNMLCYSNQVTRRQVSSVLRFDSEISFWDRDMSSLLESDCWLREKIGRVFQKVKGAVGKYCMIVLYTLCKHAKTVTLVLRSVITLHFYWMYISMEFHVFNTLASVIAL